MLATLYIPDRAPVLVSVDGLPLPDPETGFAHVTEEVATLLGCAKQLVDVMDSSSSHVTYTIFDYDGDDANLPATEALSHLSRYPFDLTDADHWLYGPVLIVTGG